MKSVDVYWSFRSPYSYLATERLIRLSEEFEIQVRPRPVYPLAIRSPKFFTEEARPQWMPYLVRDMVRIAEHLGLPLSRMDPDPIVQDMQTREVAEEQPYIHRLTGIGVLACEAGDKAGWQFLDEVSRLIWSGQPWTKGTLLADAASRAGHDLADLDRRYEADPAHARALISANEAEHAKYHWGVPLMVFEEEPFYGQDRLDVLRWRIEKTLGS